MDAELKAKWVEALRSGKYAQGERALNANGQFCCLGVLAAVKGCAWEGGCGEYADAVPVFEGKRVGRSEDSTCYLDEEFSGLTYPTQCALAEMNDSGDSFDQIAAFIEANVPVER